MSLPRELFFKKECLGEGQASRVDALKAVTLLKRCLPKEFFLKKYAWAKPRHCLGEAQGSRVEAFKSVTLFKCCLPKEFCFKKVCLGEAQASRVDVLKSKRNVFKRFLVQ
jgi:hypothetical protein